MSDYTATQLLAEILQRFESCEACQGSGIDQIDCTSACRHCGGQGVTCDATSLYSEICEVLQEPSSDSETAG